MERVTARRGVLRISTSVLLALALLFFLMPFVTAGCDPSVTYNGIDFIEGDSSEFPTGGEENGGEDESAGVLDSGAAPITLAVVFAGLGVIVGLLPGLVAVAAGYAAAAVTAGALVAFMLSGSLRGSSSAFVDFRYGFWPALALSAAASIVAWLRWQAFPARRDRARHARRLHRRDPPSARRPRHTRDRPRERCRGRPGRHAVLPALRRARAGS